MIVDHMTSSNIDVRALIERLDGVLNSLDDNDMAIPAIKIEEAINALKKQAPDNAATAKAKK